MIKVMSQGVIIPYMVKKILNLILKGPQINQIHICSYSIIELPLLKYNIFMKLKSCIILVLLFQLFYDRRIGPDKTVMEDLYTDLSTKLYWVTLYMGMF